MIVNQAIIFAGGKGTRLKEIIKDTPKPLVKINSKPFLTLLISKLYLNHIKKITLIVGPYKKNYQEFLLKERFNSINIIEDIKQIGTANAIFKCKENLDKNFFLLNGDSFCNENILKMNISFRSIPKVKNLMLVKRINNPKRYGKVLINNKRLVKNLYEKNNKIAGYINLGVYLLNKKILFNHLNNNSKSFEKDCLRKLIKKQLMNCFVTNKEFIDIGTVNSYKFSKVFFKKIGLKDS